MDKKTICESSTLVNGGKAMRFEMLIGERVRACIAIRFQNQVHAYRNFCPHQGTELDWMQGEVFDEDGNYLMCATHGAMFEPKTGLCVAGPCRGDSLIRVNCEEQDGVVFIFT